MCPILAQKFFHVDQSERRWDVNLPEGISAASNGVVIAASV
jgi:hypothetical protein